MKELDMIKAFAELESVEIKSEYLGALYIEDIYNGSVYIDGRSHSNYNPITDLTLNCAARDKYEVTIEYSSDSSFCGIGKHPEFTFVDFCDKSEVNIAVIKCILKSKGLWK